MLNHLHKLNWIIIKWNVIRISCKINFTEFEIKVVLISFITLIVTWLNRVRFFTDLYSLEDVERVKESDWFVKRFYLSKNKNVDEATKMLMRTMRWRMEMEVPLMAVSIEIWLNFGTRSLIEFDFFNFHPNRRTGCIRS